MTTTKEKPILFSGPMVRAILEGRKTQTRRLANLKHVLSTAQKRIGFAQCDDYSLFRPSRLAPGCPRLCVPVRHPDDANMNWHDCGGECLHPPYEVGMRLWVRETWATADECGHFNHLHTKKVLFKADGNTCVNRWRPSIHMPRWASRITLEITDVRVQRLQEISEGDVLAEGIREVTKDGRIVKYCVYDKADMSTVPWADMPRSSVEAFRHLWDSINAKPGTRWEDNPWVFAYTFVRV